MIFPCGWKSKIFVLLSSLCCPSLCATMSYLKNFAKLLRSSISTQSGGVVGTPGTYTLPVRKLVVRYSEDNISSTGTRRFILSPRFVALCKRYPSVEFVVAAANTSKHPLATGYYTTRVGDQNGRKAINLANLDANQVQAKLDLIIHSSGARIKPLKRRTTISRNPSPRGMWSQLHDTPVKL